MVNRVILMLFVGLALSLQAFAQESVTGVVRDATTREILPAATIQIAESYSGTIANLDGAFEISVDGYPVKLLVRHIGYASELIFLQEPTGGPIEVLLTPEPVFFEEIVVTAEDPGERIMRLVIREKQRRQELISTFAAEAYNRFTLSNDTGIVSLTESLSKFYWDRERGGREVVQAQRQTENMEFDGMMPAALFVSNLYDDDISIGGHRLMGVTHPDAVDTYDFKLVGTRSLDGEKVYDIDFKPADPLASAFVGTLSVLDGAWAMLRIDLEPGEAFLFPPPIRFFDVSMRQQYRLFDKEAWLPVDFVSELALKVGLGRLLHIPTIRVNQFSRLANYQINLPIPDSLYADETYVRHDTTRTNPDSLLSRPGVAVPLTRAEQTAVASIDSTDTMEEAFQAEVRVGRRFSMNVGGDGPAQLPEGVDYSPALWFNRVEGLHAGLGLSLSKGPLSVEFDGAYATAQKEWDRGGGLELGWNGVSAFATTSERTLKRYDSRTRSRLFNSGAMLLGRTDYFDYFRAQTAEFGVALERGSWPAVRVSLQREKGASRMAQSDFSILKAGEQPANPAVDGRTIGSVKVRMEWGEEPAPYGLAGATGLAVTFERAVDGFWGGEQAFTGVSLKGDARIPTLFTRRLIPNTLDITAFAFWSQGDVPIQRLEIVDGSDLLSVHGGLRTLAGRPYEGSRVLFVGWEHHFRTTPFERVGWSWAVERNWGLLIFGGHGKTTAANLRADGFTPLTSDGWHHEIGASLSGLFEVMRVDIARRLDEPGWAFGVGAARIF